MVPGRKLSNGKLFQRNGNWCLRYARANGEWTMVTLSTSKSDAIRKSRALIEQRDRDRMRLDRGFEDPTVRELFERYAQTRTWKPKHERRVADGTRNFLAAFGNERAIDMRLEDVEGYMQRREVRDGFARNTVLYEVQPVYAALAWAARSKILEVNPIDGVDLAPARGRRCVRQRRALTALEATLLIDTAREHWPKNPACTVLHLLAVSGLRYIEFRRCSKGDLDGRTLIVAASSTKNESARTVPLPGELVEEIRGRWPSRARRDWPLIATGKGRRYSEWSSWTRNFLDRSLELAGIEKHTPSGSIDLHSLRHTAITQMAMRGLTMAQITSIAGAQAGVIMSRYAHISAADIDVDLSLSRKDASGSRVQVESDARNERRDDNNPKESKL